MQILEIDHYKFVSVYIREQIEAIKRENDGDNNGNEESKSAPPVSLMSHITSAPSALSTAPSAPSATPSALSMASVLTPTDTRKTTRLNVGHVTLGSQQCACTIESLEAINSNDLAFKGFRKRLEQWLNVEVLGLHSTGHVNTHAVVLDRGDEVRVSYPFGYLAHNQIDILTIYRSKNIAPSESTTNQKSTGDFKQTFYAATPTSIGIHATTSSSSGWQDRPSTFLPS